MYSISFNLQIGSSTKKTSFSWSYPFPYLSSNTTNFSKGLREVTAGLSGGRGSGMGQRGGRTPGMSKIIESKNDYFHQKIVFSSNFTKNYVFKHLPTISWRFW